MPDELKPDEKKPDDKAGAITMDQIVGAMRYIMTENQKMSQQLTHLANTIKTITTTKPEPKNGGDPVDVEAMTNTELVQHVVSQIATQILKPVQEQIGELGSRFDRDSLSQQIKKAETDYPDFWEYREEIEKRMKENTKLSLDDAYTLSLKDNKEKTESLKAKREEEAAKAAAEKAAKEKPAFAGLLPTSAISKTNTRMKPSDAAEAAWEEEMANFPLSPS